MTKRTPLPAFFSRLKSKIILEICLVCLVTAIVILDGLANLSLNQDSASYLEVANRILITGHLETLVHNTDFINAPDINPYISQPPGFPLVLVPFELVIRDPVVAAVAAQVLFIALFYLVIYLMTVRLKFRPLLRLVTLILFTFIAPFLMVHRRFATETLFITLSIAAAIVALELLKEANQSRDWVLFCALVAFSSMIRYTGLANLAMIAPLVLRLDTIRSAWRLVTRRSTLIGLSAGGGLLIVLALLTDLLPGSKPGIGHMQRWGILIGAAGFIIGAVGLVLSRAGWKNKNSSGARAASLIGGEKEISHWPLTVVLVCIVPTLLWFIRNKVFFGGISPANGLLQTFRSERLWDPIVYVWNDLFNVNGILRILLAALAIFLLVLPFLSPLLAGGSGFRKTAHSTLLSGAGGHLALLWFLSLVTNIEPIRDRLFSPVLAFLILGMINGVQYVIELPVLRKWGTVLAAVPLLYLFLSSPFYPSDFIQSIGKVNYPVERQLWSEINQIDWTHTSTYFYSDSAYSAGGYIHELYSGKPQGVIWNKKVLQDPDIVRQMLSGGINPFILVTEDGDDARMLDKLSASNNPPMGKISFKDSGFVLYYLKK